MKQLFSGARGAAVVLMTFAGIGAAGAADMAPAPAYKAPYVAPPVAYSWTGCYLGGGGGYGIWNQETFNESAAGLPLTVTSTAGGRGWFGTAQVGCDYQIPTSILGYGIVLGAFADGDWGSLKGNLTIPAAAPFGSLTGSEKETSSWAAGARLGAVITPKFLAFLSGGWTQAHFNGVNFASSFLGGPVGTLFTVPSHNYNGWFIGSGYEYALESWWPGLFWKTEYRYARYDGADLPFSFAAGGLVGPSLDSKKFVQTVRSELVWRFNWGGPSVMARY